MRVRTLAAAIALAIGGVLVVAAPASAHPVLNITANPTTVNAGSATTITISGTSNGNYTGARIDVFSTGGPGTLPSFTTFGSCGGGPTCSEVGSVYRLALPNLVNNQAFSYAITLTVDAATAATTFTTKAQFYKSDNTTDGPRTGPVITVLTPTADLEATPNGTPRYSTTLYIQSLITNNGPATVTSATITITVDNPGLGIFAGTYNPDGSMTCAIADDQHATCTLNRPLAPSGTIDLEPSFAAGLLAIGTYVITTTVTTSSPTDPTPTNNTVTTTCTAVTTLIINCTQA